MVIRIDQRIVIVMRKTRMDELMAKFGTKGQAKFYVARARVNQAAVRAKAAVFANSCTAGNPY